MGFGFVWYLDLIFTIMRNTKDGPTAAEVLNQYIRTGTLPFFFRTRPLLNASIISGIGILILISALLPSLIYTGQLFSDLNKIEWFLIGLGLSMTSGGLFKLFLATKEINDNG